MRSTARGRRRSVETPRGRRSVVTTLTATAAASVLVLGGCAVTEDDTPADTGTPASTTPAPAPAPDDTDDTDTTEDDMDAGPTRIPVPGAALPTGPVPDAILQGDDVQEAIAAEADRRDVEPDAVEVVGYAVVTWPDGSLGCPKPGMMYTQALVPGRQLILAVDGRQASYHAAEDGPFSYCADPSAPAGTGTTPTDM
ncbi:hypothetical protein BJF81_14735 [Ornithinimicrobium sp. CNJ-824]|uniref:hypothetical protein n=1 Tax=Ornithinimicrobium sp. CNJ-824 TaxID=1904966 RepID=UPI00095BCBBB|nr:hypothetical protein [Ornithinimicrobium sp. CNJ-824]OLT21801.1 hypothetical protein BJF81_14735 [Ornithinimicrobium sp. CNJ-824]